MRFLLALLAILTGVQAVDGARAAENAHAEAGQQCEAMGELAAVAVADQHGVAWHLAFAVQQPVSAGCAAVQPFAAPRHGPDAGVVHRSDRARE